MHASPGRRALSTQGIAIVTATSDVPAGTLRFSAFIWSPLTAPDKQLLACDLTGTPNDCASADECKPVRARLNGIVKDRLVDGCLSDAIIYEGKLKASINGERVAITNVFVSNDKTWFGYIENPLTAHIGYLANADVTNAIVCGIPASAYCK